VSADIVDFLCLRIESELRDFNNTGRISDTLLEGAYSIRDCERCMPSFSTEIQAAAEKLIALYMHTTEKSKDILVDTFRQEYRILLLNLRTKNSEFKFPVLLANYRETINPISVLYYEVKYAKRRFDLDSEIHPWLHNLITNPEFNHRVRLALEHDIDSLQKILNRYYWAFTHLDFNAPLEIVHAKVQLKDFRHYLEFFERVLDWKLDE